MRTHLLPAALFVLLAACGGADDVNTQQEGFIRMPPPGSSMSAAYLTVTREQDDRLVRADVDGVQVTEIHRVLEEDGVMKMRPVAGLEVKAGEPLVLAPGGTHLMLIGLQDPLEEGEARNVLLTFESGETMTVSLPVKAQRRPGDTD
ncbi:MAG: copper chaperone PCu(A)C [Parvularcula sp.]|jgi:copper(I)-binding protein|nr:copper chaperone PCu(A)C [Parvularcula sp.]